MMEKPDTQEMVIVHRVFRREFGLLPDLIEAVPAGDTARAAVLAEHAQDVSAGLHHHHETEDLLLWPPLLQAVPLEADLVHRMESQHEEMSAALTEVDALLPEWGATAGEAERDRLVVALRKVATILDQHLTEEEQEILPLVRDHLSVEQWAAIGERGQKAISDKRKRLIFLGMILEDASPEEERTFLSHMPAPVRLLWRTLGRRQYDGYVARVRAA
jgi:hypothetical protein